MPSKKSAASRAPRATRSPRQGVTATKQRLVEATLQLLAKEGFQALGVNRVSRSASVDKVLIYRYFGGLEGLVEAAAASADFWPSFEELAFDLSELSERPASEIVGTLLKRYAQGIQKRPLALEILAWETVVRNEYTAAFEGVRENLALKLSRVLAEPLKQSNTDAPAVVAVLGAAVNYLCIRRRSIRVFNDVEISTDDGWRRVENAIDALCSAAFAQ